MTYNQHFAEYLENASYDKRCVLQYAYGAYGLSTMCSRRRGLGVVISIYTSDSVWPPHLHAELSDNPSVHCRYIITKNAPQSVSDLRLMPGNKDVFSTEIKENIVKWANSLRPLAGTPMWPLVKEQWGMETDNPDYEIFPD